MEKEMDEGRKRTIGVIAAIFACRKLSALEDKPSPAREYAFRDSIQLAEELLRRSPTLYLRWGRHRIPRAWEDVILCFLDQAFAAVDTRHRF
jgi:hypothetical protein